MKVEELKIKDVHPDDNYRKTMDKAKLDELTTSIKAEGVLQPITVRKNGKGYIIVFGNRRHTAAKAAGLQTIPAVIKDVTAAEAPELSIIENVQREDVNPMEESLGFKRLIETGNYNSETLAAKFGKSVPYVMGRLKLNALAAEVQNALLMNKITYGHALLFTRLKNHGDQKTLFKSVLSQDMTVEQTKENISRYFGSKLSTAEFDTSACNNCPGRSRTQVVLFPEAKKDADQCFDRSCFIAKTREHYKSYMAKLAAQGVTVVTDEKEIAALDKTSIEIHPKPTYSGDSQHPKQYATVCVKCENRAFVYQERKQWDGGLCIETTWRCKDKACLRAMNAPKGTKKTSGKDAASSEPSQGALQKARDMRNRFLRARMPEKVLANSTVQLRMIIFHLLDKVLKAEARNVLLVEFVPGADKLNLEYFLGSEMLYAAISTVPADKLAELLQKIIIASIAVTYPEMLLYATPEAGIDIIKDFVMDKDYVNTKTKIELLDFAKKLKIKDLTLTEDMKKSEMVEAIMKHDLTGKVTPEIEEECKIESLKKLLKDV